MSLLAPLYFAIGALAIGLPILFHLIRRRPKGEVEFSSLMFLQPTPPRLTRRSRLENLPLLLLRALALILLALAFARPFLRSVVQSNAQEKGRRWVLLVDTSASMQRADLWDQAKKKALTLVDQVEQQDELAIVGFDKQPRMLLSFEQSNELTPEQVKVAAKSAINDASPTWFATEMGRALSYAADLAVTYEPNDPVNQDDDDVDTESSEAHLVLISDMQQGSNIESLQAYAWPEKLKLDVRRVTAEKGTNASAVVIGSGDANGDEGKKVRVRVMNAANSESSRFRVAWEGGDRTASTSGVNEM